MAEDHSKIAESIRSGRYFSDARAWYQAICIGPVSERTFFLIIAIMSGFVGITGVMSLMALLPVVSKPAIVIPAHSEDPSRYVPRLEALKSKSDTLPEAMVRLYATHYVNARESYAAQTVEANRNFVRAQSDPAVYEAYLAQQDANNPQSPAAQLGQDGVLIAMLRTARVNVGSDSGTAEIEFTTETAGVEPVVQARARAKLQYRYTHLSVDVVKNPETGVEETVIKDPQFQVVSYVVEKY